MRKLNTTTEYVPSQEREYPAPQQIYVLSGVGAIIIIVNCLFAALIMFALARNAQSAVPAIIGGVLFYGTATPIMLFIVTGGLAQWLCKREGEVTLRQQTVPHIRLADPLQIPDSQPTPPPQLPSFVPPVAEPDDSAKREAVAWVLQLYGANGKPDPKKVLLGTEDKPLKERPGRIRIAAPSKPAKQWLLDNYMLHDLGTGYRLNLARYPTIEAARHYLR